VITSGTLDGARSSIIYAHGKTSPKGFPPWIGPVEKSLPTVVSHFHSYLDETFFPYTPIISVLASLEEPLVEFMQKAKTSRLDTIYIGIASKRVNDLKAIRQAWVENLPANSIYPTTSEFTRLPLVQNIFGKLAKDENLTEADLESIRVALDDLNIEWQGKIKNELFQIVSKSSEDTVLDPQTALNLATTFFACTTCYRSRFLRYPNVLMHKCATALDWKSSHEGDLETRFLRQHCKETLWNYKGDIVIKPEHTAFVAELVRLAGLDPKTATVQEMDALDPIFECVHCNSFALGRATMTWKTAVRPFSLF
jgi:hypothetical protein